MGFDIIDKIDNKLGELEENIDDDEVPPWFGEKETSKDERESERYRKNEDDDKTVIEIFLSDSVTDDMISIDIENDVLQIEIEGEDNFEYKLSDNENKNSINAKHYDNQNKLEITVNKN